MASKQCLDGTYCLWFASDDGLSMNTTAYYANSDRQYNARFQGLPDAKLYILKVEQFGVNGFPNNKYAGTSNGGVVGPAPSCLINVTGFTALPGDAGFQSPAGRARDGITLSRLSTNSMNNGKANDSVTPPMTPEFVICKPENCQLRFTLTDLDFNLLSGTTAAFVQDTVVPEWILCLSLRPIPDQEADRYFGR